MESGQAHTVTHRAKWVIADSRTVIENGYVQLKDGVIQSIGGANSADAGTVIDHGSGVLMPALVNVHTHLELSALAGKVDFGRDALLAGTHNAIRTMLSSGTGLVGEISTTGLTRKLFWQSELKGIWFHEKLGNQPDEPFPVQPDLLPTKDHKRCSFAGHAPHTTNPALLVRLKNMTRIRRSPFSIHLAESRDECEFLKTGKGAWAEFLMERGIDFSTWGLPVSSPVQYLKRLGILGPNSIAVHVIRVDREDLQILRESNTHVCLCLRSNQNLHDRLPDLNTIMQSGIRPCLGTDSLAGTGSLNMFDEMAFVAACFPGLAPKKIFSMATVNGAGALGMEHTFGTLMPGKIGPMIYVPVNAVTVASLLEKLIHADFSGFCERL
jgi:cytosine/adenosine deaminase-related metal-dependent hydrolase